MRTIFILLFISPLLLSWNPPKEKLSKEILGTWLLTFHVENGTVTDSYYVKTGQTDNRYNGFEFREKGELIVNMQTTFSETEPNEFVSIRGTWKKLSNSTVSVVYNYEKEWIKRTLSWEKSESGQAKLI